MSGTHSTGPEVRAAPIRVRLVAGFVAAMAVVLTAAGGFVYWRVRVALDASVDGRLATQSADLRRVLAAHPEDPAAALATLTEEQVTQVLRPDGTVTAATPSSPRRVLLTARQLATAGERPVRIDPGNLFTGRHRRLRIVAFPTASGIAVTAAPVSQRDEALRELLAQLALANLAALAVASAVGYQLAKSALAPVELYRARAQQIAAGDPSLRLDLGTGPDDEITRLGQTLNDMLAAQAAAAERQRRFVVDASHELRTPLSLLTTEVELALRRPRTSAEYEQTLQHIAADTSRLSRLADQLLALESSGDRTGGSGDLCAAARRACARGVAQGADVTASTPGSAQVLADDQQLDLLLGNLVDNAVRHGDGSVRLTVRLDGRHAVASVCDAGAGLPVELLPRAADRFRRIEGSRSTPGAGLGLALVHDLAVRLGGELRLCARGTHHTFPPARFPTVACKHPSGGAAATVVLPAAGGDPVRPVQP